MDRTKWTETSDDIVQVSTLRKLVEGSVRSIKAVFVLLDTFVISGINHT